MISSDTAPSESQADTFGQLFLAMAEGLKLPLQHIARSAELQLLQGGGMLVAEGTGTAMQPDGGAGRLPDSLRDIQASADMSLQMLDSYVLALRLSLQRAHTGQPLLELEPVSVSAVLYDAAEELQHIADSYGVTLRLHIQGRYQPVLAHRQALQSALIALGYALIEALPSTGVRHQRLQLATHRTRHGVVAGVYGELDALTPSLFQRARELQGQVRQPLVGTLPGSGAGLFVADAILGAMESRLRVGRFMKHPGFAITLPASEQLQLV